MQKLTVLVKTEINSQEFGLLKLGLLWLEQMNSGYRNKRTYLTFFSKFRIYNCIIVSQEYSVIHNEYKGMKSVIVLHTGMKLAVYTWFPYHSSDRCTEVNDITLLDSWVISAQGHFTKNTDLFPRKFSNSLIGCPTKAVVKDVIWDFTTKYVNHTDTNTL